MTETTMPTLSYILTDSMELNLSYMPFIKNGGLFVPTPEQFALGTLLMLELQLPDKKDIKRIEGKVIWITPRHALHQILSGVGIQFVGNDAKTVKSDIEAALDPKMAVGGYTYGITEEFPK